MALTSKKDAQNGFSVLLYAMFVRLFNIAVLVVVFIVVIGDFVSSKICQIGIFVLWSLVAI